MPWPWRPVVDVIDDVLSVSSAEEEAIADGAQAEQFEQRLADLRRRLQES